MLVAQPDASIRYANVYGLSELIQRVVPVESSPILPEHRSPVEPSSATQQCEAASGVAHVLFVVVHAQVLVLVALGECDSALVAGDRRGATSARNKWRCFPAQRDSELAVMQFLAVEARANLHAVTFLAFFASFLRPKRAREGHISRSITSEGQMTKKNSATK